MLNNQHIMKRHIQKTGIRKYFGRDFTELQGEPLKALDGFFAEYGACIINGCRADAVGSKFDVSSGLVALEATDPETGVSGIKVMPFDGASDVALPLYLTASATVVDRVYGDGKVKPVAYDYKAVGSTVRPSGAYIAVTTDGGNRFVDAVQDPKHQLVTDTEKATWNAKETPAGAQTKATTAETNAKAYTDTREIAIRQTVTSGDSSTLASAKSYTDTEVGKVNTSLGGHTGDNTRHITAAERGSWNAKETPAGAQAKANAAETAAKAYADNIVYAWAKAPNKPGYTINEINGDTYRQLSDISIDQLYQFSAIGNSTGSRQVAYSGGSSALWQFYSGGSTSSLQIYRDSYNGNEGSLHWRNTIDSNRFGSSDGHFRAFWDSGNFDPASKADKTYTDTKNIGNSNNPSQIRSGDLNNYTNPGLYFCSDDVDSAAVTNKPLPGSFSLEVLQAAGVIQIYTPYLAIHPYGMYMRKYYNGTWSPWSVFWTDGNFNPADKANVSHTHRVAEVSGALAATDLMYSGDYVKPVASNTGTTAIGSNASAIMYKSTAIGYKAATIVANQFVLGNSEVALLNCARSLTVTSDARDKVNIRDIDTGTAEQLIMSLRPVEFNRNDRGDYQTEDSLIDKVGNVVNYDHAAHKAGQKAGHRLNVGFIAQEVQQTLRELTGSDSYGAIVSDTAFGNNKVTDEGSRLGLAYSNLIAPMVAVMQKLSAKIEEQGAEIERIKNAIQGDIATRPTPEPEPEPTQPDTDNTQSDDTDNIENNGADINPSL